MATAELLHGIREVAASQDSVQFELQAVCDAAAGITGMEYALSALDKAQTAGAEVLQALEICRKEVELFRNPTVRSSIRAEKVFSLPELVEQIFSHLKVKDLLSACRIHRTSAAVVNDSKLLQQTLGLQPMNDSHFYAPWDGNGDWNQHSVFCSVTPASWLSVTDTVEILVSFPRDQLPELGSRCRLIPICLPGIMEMKARVSCCGRSEVDETHYEGNPWLASAAVTPGSLRQRVSPLKRNGDITMGDVYDAAQSLIAQHRLCPNATQDRLNTDGFVNVAPFSRQRSSCSMMIRSWSTAARNRKREKRPFGIGIAMNRRNHTSGWPSMCVLSLTVKLPIYEAGRKS